jgi:hypothetical protein
MVNLTSLLKKMIGNISKIFKKRITINLKKNTQNTKKNPHKIFIWRKLAETSLQAKIIKEEDYNLTNFHIVFNLP